MEVPEGYDHSISNEGTKTVITNTILDSIKKDLSFKKELQGRTLQEGEFTFNLLDEKGNVRLLDFVILTNKEHMELMDGQGTGKVIAFHKGAKPTLEDPPPPGEEQIAEQIRRKRDSLIDKVEWRIQRYQQQIALGVETNDSQEYYGKLLAYVQALRDVPKQSGFPSDVVFPELPE